MSVSAASHHPLTIIEAPPRPNPLTRVVGTLRRRHWSMLAVFAAVFVVAAAWAMLVPASYRASATILIEQQELPLDLVRSTISSYADQRLQIISQRVMTSENLLEIIDKFRLYPEIVGKKPREVIIAQMRKDIQFNMISADVVDPRVGRPVKANIAFSVSYNSPSPQLAAQVANELTSLYLNENFESRKRLAAQATGFLGTEAERLNKTITELGEKLAVFKAKHADGLPEMMSLNLQLVTRADDELRDIGLRISGIDQQIVYLDAQLAQINPASQVYTSTGERVMSQADQLKVLKSEYMRAQALYAPDHPDRLRLQRMMDSMQREVGDVDSAADLARQLEQAQTQLAEARKRYAPDHPDIDRLQRLVSSVEKTMKSAPATAAAVAVIERPDNPVFIQIRAQREALSTEKAGLVAKRAGLEKQIAELHKNLRRAPVIEREYVVLVRDLDNAQQKYREVRQKEMEAQVAENLEGERKGERFTLIEPPFVPESPASPNRSLLLVLGTLLALAAGAATGFGREFLDTRIHGRQDLAALLSVPPIAVLPWIDTEEERQRRRKYRHYALFGAGASVTMVLIFVHFFYRPLDIFWMLALRRFGG